VWEVGLVFLKVCKWVWRGLTKHETDFSYSLSPTSHIPAKPTTRGPMLRPKSTAPSLEGCWRCLSQIFGFDSWPAYIPPPTPHVPAQL